MATGGFIEAPINTEHGNIEHGLTAAEAQARLGQYGYNEIREEAPSPVRGILKRLWGPIPWMLEAALVLELVLGKVAEPAMIAAWLLFSAVVGGVQEQGAHKVLDLLRSRLRVSARVRRDGAWRLIPARELVPGDRIRVRSGDLVPADCTLGEGDVPFLPIHNYSPFFLSSGYSSSKAGTLLKSSRAFSPTSSRVILPSATSRW
jgi:H+-transporting ATPase